MSTLTAAEWNERYPIGTVVRWAGTVAKVDRPASDTDDPKVCIGGGLQRNTWARIRELTPLFTDEQRREEGWLDPAEAEKLRREIDKTRETLAIVIDQYAAAEHEREAERPVVDAARALIAAGIADDAAYLDVRPRLSDTVDALDGQPADKITEEEGTHSS